MAQWQNFGGDTFDYPDGLHTDKGGAKIKITNKTGSVELPLAAIMAFVVDQYIRPRLIARIKNSDPEDLIMAAVRRPE